MKRLACEVCGSTDLIKQEGVFVCQACGCKYTVEEVRKMMVEGTVEVTGSVQIDRSKEIENKIQNAVHEYNINNVDRAISLCMDVLNEDPENFYAIVYKALSDGWKADLQNTRFEMVTSEVQRAIEILRKQEPEDAVYSDKAGTALLEVGKFAKTIADMFKQKQEAAQKRTDEMNAEMGRVTDRLNRGDVSAKIEGDRMLATYPAELQRLQREAFESLIKAALPRKQAVDLLYSVISKVPVVQIWYRICR